MTVPYADFETRIVDLVERSSYTATLGSVQNQRLVFGGARGSGGGEGGPIQPFVGKLRQTDITFDTDEFAICTIPSGENASLLDNLNRIRCGCVIVPSGVDAEHYIVTSSGNLIEHLQGIDDALGGISVSGGHIIQDEGIDLPAQTYLNFVGSGVTVTDDPLNNATVVTIPLGGGSGVGGGHVIQDEGTPLTQRSNLNFIGTIVTVVDDAGDDATDVIISGADAGYPYNVDSIDDIDPDADFTSIGAAIASGTKTWMESGPGTFYEDFVLNNRSLKGVGQPTISGAITISGVAQLTENIRAFLDGGGACVTTVSGSVVDLKHIEVDSHGYSVDAEVGSDVEIYGGRYAKIGIAATEQLTPPTKDNILANNQPTWNFGATVIMRVGNISTVVYRSITEFDLGSITQRIVSAKLKLYVNAGNGTFTVSVYRILSGNANWPEGTSNGAQEVGASCWDDHTYNTQNWAGSAGLSTADTDYDSSALGSDNRDWGAASGWIEITLDAAEVEKLRNGEYTDCGFLLKSSAEGTANYYAEFESKEAASNQPILEVTTVAGEVINADGDVKLYGPVITGGDPTNVAGTGAKGFYMDGDGNQIGFKTFSASDAHADVIRNTSGAAASVGDVGYIDAAGEYKTTSTAYNRVQWCVVLVGGDNNTDIYIARRGKVIVTLNGNCSAGDFLFTSTTAGQAQPLSYPRAEMFAVALTANSDGAGGTCEARLYTGTAPVPKSSATLAFYVASHADLAFSSTIATLPGGAVLTYGAVTAGNENTIVNNNRLFRIVLFNTSVGNDALIASVVVGTNTITLTDSVPGTWAVGNVITATSVTMGAGWYEIDVDGTVPDTARQLTLNAEQMDTGAINETLRTSPVLAATEQDLYRNQVTGAYLAYVFHPWLINGRFGIFSSASGAATKATILRMVGYNEATA